MNGRQLRARVRSFESEAGARTLIHFVLVPVSAADRMAVLELIEEGAKPDADFLRSNLLRPAQNRRL
jgi:hypothetical protein